MITSGEFRKIALAVLAASQAGYPDPVGQAAKECEDLVAEPLTPEPVAEAAPEVVLAKPAPAFAPFSQKRVEPTPVIGPSFESSDPPLAVHPSPPEPAPSPEPFVPKPFVG